MSCIHRRDSWITFVEHARNNHQCLPNGASSSSPTTLQRYVTCTNDWKLELAIQKVREVSMRQFLFRFWCVRCGYMRLSLCLIFWNTGDHIDRRDTRSHLLQLAAKLCSRLKRSVLDLLCGHGHDRSSQQHAGGSQRERETGSSRFSWRNRSSRTRSKSGSCMRA